LKALYHDRKAMECNKICHQLAEECIDKALQAQADGASGKKKRYIFLEELLAQTNDRRRIRDELLNILLAGRDTTASLLSNLFFMLARHPHIWQKLRTEVANLDGQTPTYDQLRSFKYLKYCLNECTMLPLSVITRILTKITNTNTFSSPRSSCYSCQRSIRHQRHCSPCWRWSRWSSPCVRATGINDRI
jgi:cytochrome P450